MKPSEDEKETKRKLFAIGVGQKEDKEIEKGEQRIGTDAMFGGIL